MISPRETVSIFRSGPAVAQMLFGGIVLLAVIVGLTMLFAYGGGVTFAAMTAQIGLVGAAAVIAAAIVLGVVGALILRNGYQSAQPKFGGTISESARPGVAATALMAHLQQGGSALDDSQAREVLCQLVTAIMLGDKEVQQRHISTLEAIKLPTTKSGVSIDARVALNIASFGSSSDDLPVNSEFFGFEGALLFNIKKALEKTAAEKPNQGASSGTAAEAEDNPAQELLDKIAKFISHAPGSAALQQRTNEESRSPSPSS